MIASNKIDNDAEKEEEPATPTLTVKAMSDFLHKANKMAKMGVDNGTHNGVKFQI
jgi:hypothetical protein